MDPTQTAAALVLGVLLGLALTVPARRRVERELKAARADLATLRDRVDDLSRRSGSRPPAGADRTESDYVITSLSDPGVRADEPLAEDGDRPSRRDFASVALAESALRVASLGYGLRRALSPANRNRIRFEMAQEVKRMRRERRRRAKETRHEQRADYAGAAAGRRAEDAA